METTIRLLPQEEIPAASTLVQRVFDLFEAPDYAPQGVETFHRFTAPDAMAERLRNGAMQLWGAYRANQLVGVLGARDCTHISLLFVDPAFHRQGIGRTLFMHFRTTIHTLHCITVNSSPYAVRAYTRMGFVPTNTERTVDGIRFTPMEYRIQSGL